MAFSAIKCQIDTILSKICSDELTTTNIKETLNDVINRVDTIKDDLFL